MSEASVVITDFKHISKPRKSYAINIRNKKREKNNGREMNETAVLQSK